MIKPDFTFGDLVSVAGYPDIIFQVDGFREERHYYPQEQWDEMVYELIDCSRGDWLEADEGDLTLVADAAQADEYLRANPPKAAKLNYEEDLAMYYFGEFGFGGSKKPSEPPKPSARELSAQEAERRKKARKDRAEAVDNLLDRRKWYADSDVEDKAERIAEIDEELRKVSEIQE